MVFGFLNLSFWGYVLATFILTQITIASVTIYLHRNQTHRALTLHPVISHFFRFWLWLTTGMVTADWVAIHRKHHATTDVEETLIAQWLRESERYFGKALNFTERHARTGIWLPNILMAHQLIG